MKTLELSARIAVDAWVGKSLAKLGGVVGWNGIILLCFVATMVFIVCAIFDVWGEREAWTIPAICFAGVTLMFVVAVYGGEDTVGASSNVLEDVASHVYLEDDYGI